MGSIYWQFNDCWPVASWSSVDYYGRYKALHYAAKKFYAPVAMGLFLQDRELTVNISNETMEDFQGKIRLSLRKSDFTLLDSREASVSVEKLRSRDVFTYEVKAENPYDTFLSVDLTDEAGNFIMNQVELLVPDKHFCYQKPEFRITCTDTRDGVAIDIAANVFARGVCIDFRHQDCVLSDNFFALTDGRPCRVIARTNCAASALAADLTITSVYDIR